MRLPFRSWDFETPVIGQLWPVQRLAKATPPYDARLNLALVLMRGTDKLRVALEGEGDS